MLGVDALKVDGKLNGLKAGTFDDSTDGALEAGGVGKLNWLVLISGAALNVKADADDFAGNEENSEVEPTMLLPVDVKGWEDVT